MGAVHKGAMVNYYDPRALSKSEEPSHLAGHSRSTLVYLGTRIFAGDCLLWVSEERIIEYS
jgi:hypothetical protein